jgi:CheY-like chemotaxis protein
MEPIKTAKRKILLVDDDTSLLATVGQFLRFEGYDVATAASGEQALEHLQTQHPNLVILDMSMPGMGGIGFLQNITGPGGRPLYPVLVLTARAQMAEFFANTEVDGFIAKPADPDALLAEVGRILFLRGNEDSSSLLDASADMVLHKLIVADQDATQAAALQLALEAAGYSVEVASSGPVVLELALAGDPEAIVVRADLAQLDAASLVRLLRQMPSVRGIPVVVYGTDGDVEALEPDDLTMQVGGTSPEAILPVVGQLF